MATAPLPGQVLTGAGTPASIVVARIGSLYLRTDGGVGTSLYIKESGNNLSTGWAGVATLGGALTAGRVPYVDSNGRLADDAGLLYDAATDKLTLGQLNVATAVGKIVPGATSLSLRNNADSADNLLITDAGIASVRSTLNALAGVNVGSATGAATGEVRASTSLRAGDTTLGYMTQRVLTILTNATATIFPGSSYAVAFIHETNSIGISAAYACEQAGTFEIFDQGGLFTITLNNAGTINIYHDGTNFVAQNKTGSTIVLRCWCLHGI